MKLQACVQLKANTSKKYIVKQRNTSLQNEKHFFSASLYSRTRIPSKTIHHIMEDNFALRYVLKHPGVNSRAELVPSHDASRRRLGEYILIKCYKFQFWYLPILTQQYPSIHTWTPGWQLDSVAQFCRLECCMHQNCRSAGTIPARGISPIHSVWATGSRDVISYTM
jgi:hypothetical protein